MSRKKINLTVDVGMNIKDVIAGTTAIQNNLEKIKAPKALQDRLKRTFIAADKAAEEFGEQAKKSINSAADIKKLDTSYRALERLMEQLDSQLQELKMDPKKLIPDDVATRLRRARQELRDFQKAIDTPPKDTTAGVAFKEYEKQKKAVAELQVAEMNRLKMVAALEKQLADQRQVAADAKAHYEDREKFPSRREGGAPAARKVAEEAAAAAAELEEQVKKSHETFKSSPEILEAAEAKLEKLKNTLDEARKVFKESGLEDLRKHLAAILEVDPSEITGDMEELQAIIDGIESGAIKNAAAALEKMQQSMVKSKSITEDLGEEVDSAADKFKELADTEKEIENLQKRMISFFGIGNAIRIFQRLIKSAISTIKDLDKAMTETAVVTSFTVGDMWKALPLYTKAANELGTTTLGAYETMTLFYQQGLKTNEVFEVGTETMKMARIAGLDYAKATDLMTAALRGFNMEINEMSAQRVNDVYSELAAITAASTEEIAYAMTKTAAIANSANMQFENTSALLAQMIETTREAPENLGTAMKTIIARFTQLQKDPLSLEEIDGEVVDANKVETALRSINVALRDTNGEFRNLDDVFLDIAERWDTLTTNQQRYVASMAAGSRQQSRFIAMMSDYGRTMELVGAAHDSAGASQRQFEKTLESMESKFNQLKNAWNEFTMGIMNSTVLKMGVDFLTNILNLLNKVTGETGKLSSTIAKIFASIVIFKGGGALLKGVVAGAKTFGGKTGQTFISAFMEPIATGFKKVPGMFSKIVGLFQKTGAINNWGRAIGSAFTTATSSGVTLITVLKGIGASIYAALGPIGLTIAAVAGVALTLNALIETSKEKLERYKRASEEANRALQETKDEITDITKNFDQLNEQRTTLDNLTIGTKEWKEELAEANAEILDLIERFPELKEFIQKGPYGELYINEANQEQYLKRLEEKLESDEITGTMASTLLENLQFEVNTKDLFEGPGLFSSSGWALEKLAIETSETSTLEGEAAGVSARKGEELMINSAIYTEKVFSRMAEEGLRFSIADDETRILAIMQEVSGVAEEQAKAILDSTKRFHVAYDRTLEENEANGLKLEEATTDFVKHVIKGSDILADSDFSGGIANLLGTVEENILDEMASEVDSIGYGKDKKFTAAERAEYLSLPETSEEDLEKKAGRELAAQYMAQARVSGALEESALALTYSFEELRGKINPKDFQALQNLLKMDNSGIGLVYSEVEEARRFLKDFDEYFIEGPSGDATEAEIAEIKNIASEKGLEILPPGTREYLEGTLEIYERAHSDARRRLENVSEDVLKQLENGLLKTVDDPAVFKGIADRLAVVAGSYGEEAAKELLGAFDDVTRGMKPEEVEEFAKKLTAIDWKDVDSIESLEVDLIAMGQSAEEARRNALHLRDAFVEANKAIRSFNLEEVTNQFKKAANLLEKIQTGGDFTQEELAELLATGQADINDFALNLDGTFTYLGSDIKSLRAAVLDNTTAILQERKETLQAEIAGGEVARKTGFQTAEGLGDIRDVDRDSDEQMRQFLTNYIGELLAAGIDVDTLGVDGLTNEGLSDSLEGDKLTEAFERIISFYDNLEIKQGEEEIVTKMPAALQARGAETQAIPGLMAASQDPEEVRAYAQELIRQAQAFEKVDQETKALQKSLEGTDKAQQVAAAEALRHRMALEKVEKAIGPLSNELFSLSESLEEMEEGSLEFNYTLAEMAEKMTEVFELDIGEQFFQDAENLQLLNEALTGSDESWYQLVSSMQIAALASADFVSDYSLSANQIASITDALDNLSFNIDGSANLTPLFEAFLAAGLTVEETAKAIEALGYTGVHYEVTYDTVDLPEIFVPDSRHPEGGYWRSPGTQQVPKLTGKVIGTSTAIQAARSIPSFGAGAPSARSAPKGGGGKGGGGGKEEEPWENTIDWLYNLQKDINDEIRERNKLEREYDRLLKKSGATSQEIHDNIQKQIDSAVQEIGMQEAMYRSRGQEMDNLFAGNQDLKQYVQYDSGSHTFEIDWAKIDKVTDKEVGDRITDLISEAERIEGSMNDATDAIEDIDDQIQDLINRGRDKYEEMINTTYDSLVAAYERGIDELKRVNDTINNTNEKLMNSIQSSLEKQRRDRQNERTEDDLSEKQRRLAYLRQDTSGANQTEILALEEELSLEQENYTDQLIDQKINELQQQNEEAAAQRDLQIEIAQAQLDRAIEIGELWEVVHALIHGGMVNTDQMVLSNLDAAGNVVYSVTKMEDNMKVTYDENGNKVTEQLLENGNVIITRVLGNGQISLVELNENGEEVRSQVFKAGGVISTEVDKWGNNVETKVDESGNWIRSVIGPDGKTLHSAIVNNDGVKGWIKGGVTATGKLIQGSDLDSILKAAADFKGMSNLKKMDWMSKTNSMATEAIAWYQGYEVPKRPVVTVNVPVPVVNVAAPVVNVSVTTNTTGGGTTKTSTQTTSSNTSTNTNTNSYNQGAPGAGKWGTIETAFKTGGLADFTGPAWLDGTKSKPEMVLNPTDTKNFIQLKNILADLMKGTTRAGAKTESGNAYYNINIEVDSITDDYSVDQMVDRIKQKINEDMRYRSVNAVSFQKR